VQVLLCLFLDCFIVSSFCCLFNVNSRYTCNYNSRVGGDRHTYTNTFFASYTNPYLHSNGNITPTSTPTPTSTVYVLPGTELPITFPAITINNANLVSGLATWQENTVTSVAWPPDGEALAIANQEEINFYIRHTWDITYAISQVKGDYWNCLQSGWQVVSICKPSWRRRERFWK